MMNMMFRRWIKTIVPVLLIFSGIVSAAFAQAPERVRAAVTAAVADAVATKNAQLKLINDDLKRRLQKIASLEVDVKAGRAKLADLTTEREQYIAALSIRNETYARAVEDLRRYFTQIAQDPARLALLEKRQKGNLAEVRKELYGLMRDRYAKGGYPNGVGYATDLRALAAIALDDRGRGEAATNDVLLLYEEITRLDPESSADWRQIAELNRDAGSIATAMNAAQRSAKLASTPGDRAASYELAAEIAADEKDFGAALSALSQSLKERRGLARTVDVSSLFKLSSVLSKIADLLTEQNESSSAKKAIEEALAISNGVIALNPTALELQRPRAMLLYSKGLVLMSEPNYSGAKELFSESAMMARKLVAAEPTSEARLRDLHEVLTMLTMVSGLVGDTKGCEVSIENELITGRINSKNTESEGALKDVASIVPNTTAMCKLSGNLLAARQAMKRQIDVASKLLERLVSAGSDYATLYSTYLPMKSAFDDLLTDYSTPPSRSASFGAAAARIAAASAAGDPEKLREQIAASMSPPIVDAPNVEPLPDKELLIAYQAVDRSIKLVGTGLKARGDQEKWKNVAQEHSEGVKNSCNEQRQARATAVSADQQKQELLKSLEKMKSESPGASEIATYKQVIDMQIAAVEQLAFSAGRPLPFCK